MEEPLVSIVMAVYKPNIKWLEEQLLSIGRQTYKKFELLIWDDCPEKPVEANIFKKNLHNMNYRLFHSEKNLGSTKVFEKLTVEAKGKYISYCDQDDIWENDKVLKMVNALEEGDAVLCYSDLSVINADGKKIHKSFTEVSKRQRLIGGRDLFKHFIVRNVVVGCAMMIKADTAKNAVPFGNGFVHDHWLALCAAKDGALMPIEEQLVRYRIHGGNQTGVLKGIETKADYYQKRIISYLDCAVVLSNRFKYDEKISKILDENIIWAFARKEYFEKKLLKSLIMLYKYREFGKSLVFFESLLPFMPEFFFRIALNTIRNGKV